MATRLLPGRFTVREYHQLVELGILRADERVELLDGQIVPMTPIGPEHGSRVDTLTRMFVRLAGDAAIVRVQGPVVLGERCEPEPDLSLLRPRADRYKHGHPEAKDVLLLIEVADSSLQKDKHIKLPHYGGCGVPETWLVDIEHDLIEVHRDPGTAGYREVVVRRRGESIEVPFLRGVAVAVDDVLGS